MTNHNFWLCLRFSDFLSNITACPRDFLHKIEAVAGDFNQRKVDRGEQNFQVKTVKFHEKYQHSSPMSYDIALLEIKGRIHFGKSFCEITTIYVFKDIVLELFLEINIMCVF